MASEQDHYENLHQSRASEAKANSPSLGSQGGQNSSSEAERYNQLQNSRIEDSKKSMTSASRRGNSTDFSKKGRIASLNNLKKLSPKDAKAAAMGAATAFTAVDFEKDGIHFVVIIFSIIADLLTFIPIVGSFLAIPFSILIWILYAIGGHLKNRIGRKVVVTAASQAAELLGFAFLSMLPFYTIAAIVNFWFALTERKIAQQEAKKNK